jgi:hypothetical protein
MGNRFIVTTGVLMLPVAGWEELLHLTFRGVSEQCHIPRLTHAEVNTHREAGGGY